MGTTPQRILEKNARWRNRNPEKKGEADKRYREKHRDEINAKIREKRKNGEWKKKKAHYDAKYFRQHRQKVRQQTIAALGGNVYDVDLMTGELYKLITLTAEEPVSAKSQYQCIAIASRFLQAQKQEQANISYCVRTVT
jgi:hypothetical protein